MLRSCAERTSLVNEFLPYRHSLSALMIVAARRPGNPDYLTESFNPRRS